jgi:hypothetical protein
VAPTAGGYRMTQDVGMFRKPLSKTFDYPGALWHGEEVGW